LKHKILNKININLMTNRDGSGLDN
jgi:hypothetical protein